jgi:two-component system, LuxR family, sensor kinase FixL
MLLLNKGSLSSSHVILVTFENFTKNYFSIMIDHTDIKQLYESILETAVDGIINIDPKGIVVNINKAALNIFQYRQEEIIGQRINILMGQHDSTHHDQYINNYLTTRKPKIIGIGREVLGRKKDGTLFPFRLAVSEVILNDKILFTGIIHDLQDVKLAYNELKALNEELDQRVADRTAEVERIIAQLLQTNTNLQHEIKERKTIEEALKLKEVELERALSSEKGLNEMKSRFITTASHEFRTPLTAILSSVALIGRYKTTEDEEKREKHVHKIKNAVTHLTGLLNDFLSLSMLEEEKVNVHEETFDLADLIYETIDDLSPILKPNQQIVHEPIDIKITNDKKIIKNILFNIISNAIKYSEKEILLKIIDESGKIFIKVIDKGIGIPQDELPHLTNRFFRATNVGNIQGTGLGLNIVTKYCELINSKFTIESKENEGTTITITINK